MKLRSFGWICRSAHANEHTNFISWSRSLDRGFDVYSKTREAAAALRRLASEPEDSAPYFFFAHTYRVHDPYVSSDRYRELFCDPEYDGGVISSREDFPQDTEPSFENIQRVFWGSVDSEAPADLQRLLDLYDAGIRAADDMVGALVGILRETGRDQRTLILLVSDHGEEFLEHGGFLHEDLHAEVLRVPFILYLPPAFADLAEQVRARRISETVNLIDVTPTLLDLLGLTVPAHVQGTSLRGLIEGRGEPRERFVLSQLPVKQASSLQVGPWKYITRGGSAELFDLSVDPGETLDLSVDANETVRAMQVQLDRLLEQSRALSALTGGGAEVEASEEMLEDLRRLGYLGGADE